MLIVYCLSLWNSYALCYFHSSSRNHSWKLCKKSSQVTLFISMPSFFSLIDHQLAPKFSRWVIPNLALTLLSKYCMEKILSRVISHWSATYPKPYLLKGLTLDLEKSFIWVDTMDPCWSFGGLLDLGLCSCPAWCAISWSWIGGRRSMMVFIICLRSTSSKSTCCSLWFYS